MLNVNSATMMERANCRTNSSLSLGLEQFVKRERETTFAGTFIPSAVQQTATQNGTKRCMLHAAVRSISPACKEARSRPLPFRVPTSAGSSWTWLDDALSASSRPLPNLGPSTRIRPELMPLSDGARLGPYEILAAIGAGGMGEVYRARDTRLDRAVAVKVLPVEFARDAAIIRRPAKWKGKRREAKG